MKRFAAAKLDLRLGCDGDALPAIQYIVLACSNQARERRGDVRASLCGAADLRVIDVEPLTLRGRWIYPIAVLALATGARRGELCALRWKDVDLEAARIRIEGSLEQTNAGLRFKEPKTKAGRRTISISPAIVAELRQRWRAQQEQRLAMGLGRAPDEALVFARLDGTPVPPDTLTQEWARLVRILKLPKVTFHALRHTHASQLIANGLDVVTVSRRLGHGNPTVTLNVYSHLFGNTDERAAAIVEAAMSSALLEPHFPGL
jgi:integrase